MKLIHLRLFPRWVANIVKGSIPISEEVRVALKEMESREIEKMTKTLEKANLKPFIDFTILTSLGLYDGKGDYKEMEIEVFDL